MAVRMRQRRATAEQWLLADPILAAGELGWEASISYPEDGQPYSWNEELGNWELIQ